MTKQISDDKDSDDKEVGIVKLLTLEDNRPIKLALGAHLIKTLYVN